MAGRKDKAAAPSSTPGSRHGAGFELRLERGGAAVRLADQPIVPGLRLESLTLQVPDVKFPFDVGQGAGQFRHRLSELVELSVVAEPALAEAALAQAGLAAFGVEDVRLAAREGFLEIAGRLSGGPPFVLAAGLLPHGEQGVALVFHSPRILGPSPMPAAALPHVARAVVEAVGEERLPPEPLAPLLRRVLAGRAWKLPRSAEARVARAEIAGGVARIAWDRGAVGPAATAASPELLAADEGARTFHEAEALTAGGDYAGAREAWLAAGSAPTAHPFAAERLLSLLVLEDRFHEEALDLAGEWLARRPGFPPALAAEATVRLWRGEDERAARALAALAQGAAGRGEQFCALLAAEAAFSLAGAARADALLAVETALGLRRDHVPALRALRGLSRAAGDKEGLLRASRRLVAYDPDPASKARAHAELGELLLAADPPGARLHLDQALRLAPDDVDALSALARACAGAGEPLRAVRALDRLRELHLARGDRAAAARDALEAGALWDDPLGHPENALLRYRDACELAPSADAHARAARAAERAGQWAEAADQHAAVLSSLDLSAAGAAALAVRTRVALADVAEVRLADPEGAAVHLEAAAALAPEDATLLRRLAALERGLGRVAGVVAALDRLAPLEADPAARAALLAEAGEGAIALGRAGDARSRFAAAIAADGACRPALLGLSRLARERGDAVAERDALLRLLPLAPDAAEAASLQDALADACERAGDLAGATEAAAAARRAAPSPERLETALRLARRTARPAELAVLLAERARAALAAGEPALATDLLLERARLVAPTDPALALAALAEARAASPGDGGVLRAQAELAERTGDTRLALGCLRALLASTPPDAPALELRAARAAVAAGETLAAREHAERALDRGAPGAAEVLEGLLERIGDDGARGEVLGRLGRHLEAARLFERAGDPPRARAALELAAADPALAAEALPRLAELRLAEDDGPGAALALLALARLTPGREGAPLALRAHGLGGDPAALDLAAERDPAFAPALAARARLRAPDDPRAALADAEAALAGEGLEEGERPGLLVLAARVAAAAGDGAAARRHLGAYCEAHPDDDGALARLGALHRAAGARRELGELLERRLSLASGAEAVRVRLELSDLLAPQDPARAARLALEALALEPGSLAALRALATPPRAAHVPAADRGALLARLAGRAEATPAEAAAAHAMRARLLAEAGDAPAALEAARAAVRLGAEEDDDALELRASLAARAGDAAEAARALLARAARAGDRAEPDAAERLAEAGLAALAAGDGAGEEALRRALDLGCPDRETERAVLEALAARARDRGDAPTEREALAAVVPLLPTGARPPALLRHAALALAAGDAAAARASAEEARALAPRDPAAVEACRAAALAGGDVARVAELLGTLAELEPAAAGPRLLDRARLLASLGDDEAADAAFGAALAALPPDRALADEHARHRRERRGGRGAAAPLEAFAGRAADRTEAAHALRAAAATALAVDDPGTALRCARRAYARTQDDLAFAAPLLARVLYLRGGGDEALVLHRRLLEAGFPGVAPEDAVALCRQAAELAEDAGEVDLARAAYDRLLALRPQDVDAALRRFELEPDRARAVRDLADAAEACRSQRGRALALARAGDAALREADARDLGERLFRRARQDAARDPALAARIGRLHAAALRAADGASSPVFLETLRDAAASAQAAGDRAAARELLEEAVAVERGVGRFADAARDLLSLDALAAEDGDLAGSPARLRAAAALLREAGDSAGVAEVLRRAWAASPGSEEDARALEAAARALGDRGAPLLVELEAHRVSRAEPGPSRADALVALAGAHRAAGAPLQAEAALRAALADAPDHEAAEERLLELLGEERRGAERARLLLARADRSADPGAAQALRRAAAEALAGAAGRADRTAEAEAWAAVAAGAPDDLGAARAAARLLVGLGRREEAIPHLARVLRADPDDDEAANVLAEAYAGRHRERAELFLSRAAHARGEARAARLREAARGFFAAEEDGRAREALREAFAAWPADSAAFAEALRDASVEVERIDGVLLARARAVPADAGACHRARADALQAFGETERAIAAYEAARAADPRDVEALASLATCVAAGRGDDAARALDREVVAAWEAAPAAVPAAAEAPSRYRLGLALVRDGEDGEAIAHLERAVVLAPGDARAAEAWSAVAHGHARRGETASALAAARFRVNRAAVVGPEAELRAALADEAALAEELGVPAPPPPRVLAAPPAEAEAASEAARALAEPPEPAFHEAPGVEPSFDAGAPDDDPLAAARAAADRATALEEPGARAAAWVEAAEALARGGAEPREVRAALDLACDADSDSPEPWRARARLEAQLGDGAAAARAHLSASIRAEGEDAARAALDAARLFEEAGRHGDAVRAYRAALHARPGCVPEESLRAAEALAAGDVAAAADLLAGIDPSALPGDWRAPHARKLARALDAAGRAGDAARAWLEIFHEAPADPEAFARAADLALASGGGVDAWVDLAAEHEQALGAWATAERRRDLRCERGRLFAEAGRLEAARGALLAALELDPGHGPTLDALASLDGRADDWTRIAAGLWEEGGAAADPAEAAAVYLRLGRLLSDRLRDEGGAIAALRAALARAAGSPSPAAARCAAEARALLEELGAAAEEAAPAGAPSDGPLDGVAVVLRAQADAETGAARAELLERLAAHLERGGDREGAADALEGAVLADPPRDAAFAGLAALVAPDDARLARAAEARERRADDDAPETWFAFEAGAVDLEVPPEEPGAAAETPIAFEGGAAEPEAPPEEPGAAPSPRPDDGALPAEAANEPVPDPGAAAGDAASPDPHGGEEDAFAFAADEEEALDVESSLPPIGSGDPQDYARDGRLRLEAGDLSGAYERLSIALAREPSDLLVARDLGRAAEQLGLFEEYVLLGEACADAVAPHDPAAAAARFRHFAEVLRDRLGQTDRAGVMLEKALALAPEDPDTLRELVQVWSSHPETSHRALEIWLDLARADPSDGEALAGVAEIAAHVAERAPAEAVARPMERARIAASLASFVAPATCAPPIPGRLAAEVSEELRARIAAPGAVGPLARLLRLLAPWLEPLFPADLGRRGATPADRLAPDRAPVLAATLDAAARALRTRPHDTFLSSRPGVEVAVENCHPPAVILTAPVTELPAASLAFLAARTLDLLDHGWTLAGKFSPKDVGILLELACRFAGASPPPCGLPAERAGAFLTALEAHVPAETRAEAGELGAAAAMELAELEPRAFTAALRRTANRVALLYAGDPGPALHALALLDRRLEGPLDPARALALPDLRDLALFALSEPFLDLRTAALG